MCVCVCHTTHFLLWQCSVNTAAIHSLLHFHSWYAQGQLKFIILGLEKFELWKTTKLWHIYIYFNIKIFESETSKYYNTMHLYHVHTKINIPSINNRDKCPRQQHHVTVISVLIKKAAFILAEQHGQIQCTMD